MSEIETWRNAPRCPEHPDEPASGDCERCFAEGVEGGVSWITDEVLYGTTAIVTNVGPYYRNLQVQFEGLTLFTMEYVKDDGVRLPPDAAEAVRRLEKEVRDNVRFWDEQISKLEEADAREGNPDLLHRAMQARGVAGARLDRIEHWAVDKLEPSKPAPKSARLSVPPGRRAV